MKALSNIRFRGHIPKPVAYRRESQSCQALGTIHVQLQGEDSLWFV